MRKRFFSRSALSVAVIVLAAYGVIFVSPNHSGAQQFLNHSNSATPVLQNSIGQSSQSESLGVFCTFSGSSSAGDSTGQMMAGVSCAFKSPKEVFEDFCKALEKHGQLCPVFLEDIVDNIFIIYDHDEDGILSEDELRELLKDMGYNWFVRREIFKMLKIIMEEAGFENLGWRELTAILMSMCEALAEEGKELPDYCIFI